MSDDKKTTSPTSGDGGTPVGCTTLPCKDPCVTRSFPSREVNHNVTEVISNAPAPYTAWNGTYSWTAKYTVAPSRNPCALKVTVKIKTVGTISAAQKTAWKTAIEGKWNGKAKVVCPDPACSAACPNGYPVSIEVSFVNSGEHYVVNANSSPATGARSVTPDMGTWGVNDTVDITHEFGHMLGSPEEYFSTNGTDYTAGGTLPGFRRLGGPVMNNPAGDPLPRNYDVVGQEAGTAMGLTCSIQTV
jgi:hypothetical protein